jgi:hypothetical protein
MGSPVFTFRSPKELLVVGLALRAKLIVGPDGQRRDIVAGQAVLWSPGEEHGSGSDEGMTVVIAQASVRLPYG